MSVPTPDPRSQYSTLPEAEQWFAAEVQPHHAGLRAWLRGKFPWLSDVDDVVQDSLLRLWKRRQQPAAAPIKSPKATLYAIARNAAIDRHRHQLVAKTDGVADLQGLPVFIDEAGVEQTVAAREELDFLAAALRELPDRGRQVMTLTKIYGQTEREVAERLGISESTVRTHIVRGMKHCADYLRERGIERGQT